MYNYAYTIRTIILYCISYSLEFFEELLILHPAEVFDPVVQVRHLVAGGKQVV